MALDPFLKLQVLAGEAHKPANDFDRLGVADLDGKLVDDISSVDTAILRSDLVTEIKYDALAIGVDFFRIAREITDLASPAGTFDDPAVKFADQLIYSNTNPDLLLSAANLLEYENDDKSIGIDFFRPGSDVKDGAFESLSLNLNKISLEYKEQVNDGLNLGVSFAEFGNIAGASESKLPDAFMKLSSDLHSLEYSPHGSSHIMLAGHDLERLSPVESLGLGSDYQLHHGVKPAPPPK